MNSPDRRVDRTLPARITETLRAFETGLGARIRIVRRPSEGGGADEVLYASQDLDGRPPEAAVRRVLRSGGRTGVELQVGSSGLADADTLADALEPTVTFAVDTARELKQFTYELSDRFEEINLLYSISETIGTTVDLVAAAHQILGEVCEVMGARRGSIWVYRRDTDALHLAAEVGEEGRAAPMSTGEPDTITGMVFREGRSIIATRAFGPEDPTPGGPGPSGDGGREPGAAAETASAGAVSTEPSRGESFLSVPIRYSPGRGEARTVGVMNLIGRRDGGRFTAGNQRLLAAIASQVGAAIENTRLVRKTLSRERMVREMELAHDLQMKLLPDPSAFGGAEAAGRVEPTEEVGGDFYQLFQLADGKVGVMLGDVSLHGFPSALIMTLAMSATSIYAREYDAPGAVLRGLDDALREELETTEMFLTAFYGVLDPVAGTLEYANAGHPHAFAVHPDGTHERLGAMDPPVGFAGADAYHQATVPWTMGKDLLLLFTDGLSDALTNTTRGNGEKLVLETAVRHRFSSAEEIIRALFDLTVSAPRPGAGDDRTALVVRR